MKKIIALIVCLSVVFAFAGCSKKEEPYDSNLFVMSTYVTQQLYGKNKEKAAESVNTLLKELEKELSLFIDDSDIDNINQNAGIAPVKVEDYTFQLIKTAKEYSELSQGSFDITIAPLTLLWGIDTENAHVPKQSELDEAVELVDYKKIVLDDTNKTVFLETKGMALDLGGIAKGYIINKIKAEYHKEKITSAVVSIGGNIFTYGAKPDKTMFKLGIRDPKGTTGNELLGKLSVDEKVVATSGAYERYFKEDGKIYHHILDVKTGYPVESDIQSITIICDDGGVADFLSTTLFIAGKSHIDDYINDERFSVIVVDDNNKVYLSDAIKPSFELTNKNYSYAEGR